MNQSSLESSDALDRPPSSNAVPAPNSGAGMTATGLAALIPCAIYALDLPQGRQTLSAYEGFLEAAIATLLCRHLLMRKNAPRRQIALAGLAFAMVCLSLAQVPQALQSNLFALSDGLLIQSNLCYCLALCGICFVFIALAHSSRADILYWTSAGAIALTLYGIQYRYLLVAITTASSSSTFLVFSKIYAGLSASGVSLAILHSLRTLDKFEFTLSSAVMLMFALDFAGRYNLAHVRDTGVTVAQCLWVSIVVGLCPFFLRNLSKPQQETWSNSPCTAEWLSVRVIFGMFLFFANVVLLVGILVADLLTIQSALHATILLLLLFSCWVASNRLALKISTDMRLLLAAMPSASGPAIASQGLLPQAIGQPIGRRTLMAEVDAIIGRYNILVQNANELVVTLVKEKRSEAVFEQAQQVAHDIRSPLAAFNIILPDLVALPEDTRVMLRNAIFRIQDIAGSLLQSGRKTSSAACQPVAGDVVMISSLVEAVVCEKRVQYRDRLNVYIESAVDATSYALFSKVASVELKRIISNLINNSVEAVSPRGSVTVFVRSDDTSVYLDIQDNGPGIPDQLLSSLGQRGSTIGKENGNGLGLFHACSVLNEWGGSLHFQKPSEGGTIATISLKRATSPQWFLGEIDLRGISQVVVVDDDLSIHEIWSERFARCGLNELPRTHLSTGEDFLSWCTDNQDHAATTYLLVDYELVGSEMNGIRLLCEAKQFNRRALVTSRTEEPAVLAEALRLGVRMVPKEVAAFVPIVPGDRKISKVAADAILIDNDPLVQSAWRMAGRISGKSIECFISSKDFVNASRFYDKNIPVYIDQNLGSKLKGTDVAQEIHSLGFHRIYLQTGDDPKVIPDNACITKVVGKDPPSWLLQKTSSFKTAKQIVQDLRPAK